MSTIEHRTNHEQAKTTEIEGAIDTSDKHSRKNSAELNATGESIQRAAEATNTEATEQVQQNAEAANTEEARPEFAIVEQVRVDEDGAVLPLALIEETSVSIEEAPGEAHTTERRHLVKAAALVSLGNFGSSALGMVRQVAVATLGKLYAGPFLAALTPANNFYQLLVNGAVSGALIPTFNDY
ncbi:MAG TPA: hypothetical protein VF099_09370, partial [Ktedonobacterales bacterium]